jgi:hypothetical protein
MCREGNASRLQRFRNHRRPDALARFRSNRFAGLLMFLACLVVRTS